MINFVVVCLNCFRTLGKTTSETSKELSVEDFDSAHGVSDSSLQVVNSVNSGTGKLSFVTGNLLGVSVTVWAVTSLKVVLQSFDVFSMDGFDLSGESITVFGDFSFDSGSGFGEFGSETSNDSINIGFLFFASLFIEAFWIFDQDVAVVLGGAPSSVEVNGVTVQVLWWHNVELVTGPVLV